MYSSIRLPWWLSGKESGCQCRGLIRSLGWEDPLEKEMAIHSRILARRIPWTEGPGALQSMKRVWHDLGAKLTTLQQLAQYTGARSHFWKLAAARFLCRRLTVFEPSVSLFALDSETFCKIWGNGVWYVNCTFFLPKSYFDLGFSCRQEKSRARGFTFLSLHTCDMGPPLSQSLALGRHSW